MLLCSAARVLLSPICSRACLVPVGIAARESAGTQLPHTLTATLRHWGPLDRASSMIMIMIMIIAVQYTYSVGYRAGIVFVDQASLLCRANGRGISLDHSLAHVSSRQPSDPRRVQLRISMIISRAGRQTRMHGTLLQRCDNCTANGWAGSVLQHHRSCDKERHIIIIRLSGQLFRPRVVPGAG